MIRYYKKSQSTREKKRMPFFMFSHSITGHSIKKQDVPVKHRRTSEPPILVPMYLS